jgi:hypothetical protein
MHQKEVRQNCNDGGGEILVPNLVLPSIATFLAHADPMAGGLLPVFVVRKTI